MYVNVYCLFKNYKEKGEKIDVKSLQPQNFKNIYYEMQKQKTVYSPSENGQNKQKR